jgi:predicted regulator of Ras-like GTPase activity (Roadblock/LC7/MglB family)
LWVAIAADTTGGEGVIPMQIDTEQALTSLLDVVGVEGSFLVNGTGALAAWNMPSTVEEEILDEAGAKLARLRQAFAVAGQELDFCTVRFARYKLCLKASDAGIICVLTRPDVNLPALRMALKLILHQIASGRSSDA